MQAIQTLRPAGELIREWRQRRRLSQLDLALEAEISTRHLSFIETGRSRASREMLTLLADRLDVPLRERNQLFTAAGLAPPHYELPIDHPDLAAARRAMDLILGAHEPFPALAIDRHWNMVGANAGVKLLMAGAAPKLLEPPVNVLRLALHPEGLAPAIINLGEFKAHLVERLNRQLAMTGDTVLAELIAELIAYPAPQPSQAAEPTALFTVMRIVSPAGELSFFSTTTMFGTPHEVTLSEMAIEAFFPADAATSDRLRILAGKSD